MLTSYGDPRSRSKSMVFGAAQRVYVTKKTSTSTISGRLGFPNTHFDPMKAHITVQDTTSSMPSRCGGASTHHDQRASRRYWCMKPCVNLDAAVLTKVTKRARCHPGQRHRHNDPSGWPKRSHAGLAIRRPDHLCFVRGARRDPAGGY